MNIKQNLVLTHDIELLETSNMKMFRGLLHRCNNIDHYKICGFPAKVHIYLMNFCFGLMVRYKISMKIILEFDTGFV